MVVCKCKGIEVWCTIDGVYKHVHKLQIDSSVKLGCTLSSDLLCLATADEESKSKEKNYIFAGGVDGRIHRWSIHSSSNDKFLSAGSFSAHDGRVNDLAVCQSMGILVSIGSDGYVHCRLMDNSCMNPSEWKVVSLDITDYFRKDSDTISTQRKATSLCIIHEDSSKAQICVGTSCGHAVLININKADDMMHASFISDVYIASEKVEGNVVVHALCSDQYEDSSRILIGHSNGLSIWDAPLSTCKFKFIKAG